MTKQENTMTLSQLQKGDTAKIIRLDVDKILRNRFASFGVMPGEEVTVRECSLAKQTLEIQIGSTTVALRKEEADKVIVDMRGDSVVI
jgi:ferrous iron transport protein A